MAILKYISGNEHCEVIEHENFSDSIFSNQYAQALQAIDRYLNSEIDTPDKWNRHQNGTLRTIAFNGERGEGKSSCMRTVAMIIENFSDILSRGSDSKDKKFIEDLKLNKLNKYRFEILPVIDPAFFDDSHNVLEFIIGQIYTNVIEFKGKNDRINRNELMKKFQRIKLSISELHGRKPSAGYDEISDLSSLASSMHLRSQIEEMMALYLDYIRKDRLIITIDDIDLNMKCAYEMCEQLRKYLGNKYCLVLISVKLPQLLDAISNSMAKQLSKDKISESYEMATKYIDKLLPSSIRIAMPKMYGLSDIKLEVYTKGNATTPIYENTTVKDGVVELIFQRTRYLFYNSLSGVSPIVPSNLREFMMLLGLLITMPEISPDHSSPEETKKLNSNKLIFKEYFYTEWVQRLNANNREEISKWLKPENKTSQNKLIAQYFGTWTDYSKGNRDYSDNDEFENDQNEKSLPFNQSGKHFDKIVSIDNFGYNVSVGDVFHLIYLLEQDKLDSEQELMLFFIKSHYSIMLYEAYDEITKSIDKRYPKSTTDEGVLYRFDSRFSEVNELQRLVGSYFTFEPHDILPYDRDTREAFDLRELNFETDWIGQSKSKWVNLLKTAYEYLINPYNQGKNKSGQKKNEKKNSKEPIDKKLKLVRIAEFFLLTISRNIPSKDKGNPLESNFRKNVRPAYAQTFNSPMKDFLFDVLMPFTAMTNIKFAYNRFHSLYAKETESAMNMDFYTLALHTPGTLLRDMIVATNPELNNEISKGHNNNITLTEENIEKYLHRLLSDSIIRNGEVLAAILANLKGKRFEIKDKSGIAKIGNLYDMIQKGGMSTHRLSKDDEPYKLKFAFLSPIISFLNSLKKDQTFFNIFNNLKQSSNSDSKDNFLDYVKTYWKAKKDGTYPTRKKDTIIKHFGKKLIEPGSSLKSLMDGIEEDSNLIDEKYDYSISEFADLMYAYRFRFEGYTEPDTILNTSGSKSKEQTSPATGSNPSDKSPKDDNTEISSDKVKSTQDDKPAKKIESAPAQDTEGKPMTTTGDSTD